MHARYDKLHPIHDKKLIEEALKSDRSDDIEWEDLRKELSLSQHADCDESLARQLGLS